MKKILVVAALLATTAAPAFAADVAAPPPAPKVSAATCFFLPLLPGCLDVWKAKHDEFTKKVAVAPTPKLVVPPPKVRAMPTCAKAAAGAGHLLDCKM